VAALGACTLRTIVAELRQATRASEPPTEMKDRPNPKSNARAGTMLPPRSLRARRLLVATIGAASVTFAGCGEKFGTFVSNLMAPPFMPPASAHGNAAGAEGCAVPPSKPQPSATPGVSSQMLGVSAAGSSGATPGCKPPVLDAGSHEDAGN
jgi:hypothetical protein